MYTNMRKFKSYISSLAAGAVSL